MLQTDRLESILYTAEPPLMAMSHVCTLCYGFGHIYTELQLVHVVQFYPWFKIVFPFVSSSYHTLPYIPKQRNIKSEPRIKLINHNIYSTSG